jgi:hypothetical protein
MYRTYKTPYRESFVAYLNFDHCRHARSWNRCESGRLQPLKLLFEEFFCHKYQKWNGIFKTGR